MLLKVDCLPNAVGKQPSIPLIYLGGKWTLNWWWWWWWHEKPISFLYCPLNPGLVTAAPQIRSLNCVLNTDLLKCWLLLLLCKIFPCEISHVWNFQCEISHVKNNMWNTWPMHMCFTCEKTHMVLERNMCKDRWGLGPFQNQRCL